MRKIPESASEVVDSLEWRDYHGNRKISTHPAGFFVIIPKSMSPCPPVFCPVCKCSMSTSDDLNAHETSQCCYHCKEKWYYPNRDRWNAGWRPGSVRCDYKKTIVVGE